MLVEKDYAGVPTFAPYPRLSKHRGGKRTFVKPLFGRDGKPSGKKQGTKR
jgi:hypothetical protein